jgi:excinuclease ABC subunit B
MGPHASLSIPNAATPRPVRTVDVPTEAEKKTRRGRPRKTGRPGH